MTARKDKIQLVCPACKMSFEVHPCNVNKRVCCSVECTAANKRRTRQAEIEAQFGKPIADLLREMYCDQQRGIKAIARAIGVSDRNLWSWFDELGIERRDRSTAVALQWVDNDERKQSQAPLIAQIAKEYRAIHGNPAKRPDVRKKISESKRGEKNPMRDPEVRRKVSETHKKLAKRGAANPDWKGGKITKRGRNWAEIRLQIIERDGGMCQKCGATEKLQVHHIKPYRETQDNSHKNLVTLCVHCHGRVEQGSLTL